MAPWRSGYVAVCKTVYTGSSPVGASNFIVASTPLGGWWNGIHGGLKILCPYGLAGSIPAPPTSNYMRASADLL